jgi:hypothetical protein
MSTTPNLLIPLIASGQASKEITMNTGLADIDGAMTAVLVTSVGSIDYTMPVPAALYNLKLSFVGGGAFPININLPAYPHHYIVENATGGGSPFVPGSALTFRVLGGGRTVAVPAGIGKFAELYCDGYNVDRLGPDVAFEHDGSWSSNQQLLNLRSGTGISVTDDAYGTTISSYLPSSLDANILVGSHEASYVADIRDQTVFAHIRGRSMLSPCKNFNVRINFSSHQPGSSIAPENVTIDRIAVYKMPQVSPQGNLFAPYSLTSVVIDSLGSPIAYAGTTYLGTNLGSLLPGTTVRFAGFANYQNNGIKIVTNSTPTSVTVAYNGEIAESPSPPTGTVQVAIINNEGGTGSILYSSRGGATDIVVSANAGFDPKYDYVIAAIATTASNPSYAVAAAVGDTFANDGNTLKGALYSGDATLLTNGDVLPAWTSYGPGILFMQFMVAS